MACNRPIRALPMRASLMNLSIASKIVVIEVDDHAAPYLEPMTLDAMHALEQRAGLGPHIFQRRFIWALDADEDAPEIGKTVLAWLRWRVRADSRAPVASVRCRLRSVMAFLLPNRLSSTTKTMRNPAFQNDSSSARICPLVLRRGRRPNVTMMSQNSQVNGQRAKSACCRTCNGRSSTSRSAAAASS